MLGGGVHTDVNAALDVKVQQKLPCLEEALSLKLN